MKFKLIVIVTIMRSATPFRGGYVLKEGDMQGLHGGVGVWLREGQVLVVFGGGVHQ